MNNKRNLSFAQRVAEIYRHLEGLLDPNYGFSSEELLEAARRIVEAVNRESIDSSHLEQPHIPSYHSKEVDRMFIESPFLVSFEENRSLLGFEEDSGYNEKDFSPRLKKGNKFL